MKYLLLVTGLILSSTAIAANPDEPPDGFGDWRPVDGVEE
jgi:hypothetical protein